MGATSFSSASGAHDACVTASAGTAGAVLIGSVVPVWAVAPVVPAPCCSVREPQALMVIAHASSASASFGECSIASLVADALIRRLLLPTGRDDLLSLRR